MKEQNVSLKKPKIVHESWASFFDFIMTRPEWENILTLVRNKREVICPDVTNVFKAFSMPLDNVKTVFLGLSPYQNIKRNKLFATGLAFGVPDETMDTPSLKVIRDELERSYPDRNVDSPNEFDYTLEHWHNQGVLLLNSALTVRKRADARIHCEQWRGFTSYLMKFLNAKLSTAPFVFMGKDAQKFNVFIDQDKHEIINVYHPAAEARGGNYKFTGSNVFLKVNSILTNLYNEKIDWLYENSNSVL